MQTRMTYQAFTAGGARLSNSFKDPLVPITQARQALLRGYPVWIRFTGPPERTIQLKMGDGERVRVLGDDGVSHVIRALLRNQGLLQESTSEESA